MPKLREAKTPIALVTGASGVLGLVISRGLADVGYHVIGIDLVTNQPPMHPDQALSRVTSMCIDVTDPDQVSQLAKFVASEYGRVDLLVNNAARDTKVLPYPVGGGLSLDPIRELLRFPIEQFREVLNVNAVSPLLMAQALVPLMRDSENASIVNIASIYGIRTPDQSLYSRAGMRVFKGPDYPASKAALLSLSDFLAVTLAPWGIRSNAVSPGAVGIGLPQPFVEQYSLGVPQGRTASAQDVSNAVNFLASREASHITGHNLVVDGGRSAW